MAPNLDGRPGHCRESLLAGALGQAVFGDQLFSSEAVDVNPLFVAGWAGGASGKGPERRRAVRSTHGPWLRRRKAKRLGASAALPGHAGDCCEAFHTRMPRRWLLCWHASAACHTLRPMRPMPPPPAGLIINAINCLPAGELDGGRTFLGLCGRRAASRMGAGAQAVQPVRAPPSGWQPRLAAHPSCPWCMTGCQPRRSADVGRASASQAAGEARWPACPPSRLPRGVLWPGLPAPSRKACLALGSARSTTLRPAPSPLCPAVSLLLLGLAGFSNSLALFWLLLVVTLQRGPVRSALPDLPLLASDLPIHFLVCLGCLAGEPSCAGRGLDSEVSACLEVAAPAGSAAAGAPHARRACSRSCLTCTCTLPAAAGGSLQRGAVPHQGPRHAQRRHRRPAAAPACAAALPGGAVGHKRPAGSAPDLLRAPFGPSLIQNSAEPIHCKSN